MQYVRIIHLCEYFLYNISTNDYDIINGVFRKSTSLPFKPSSFIFVARVQIYATAGSMSVLYIFVMNISLAAIEQKIYFLSLLKS